MLTYEDVPRQFNLASWFVDRNVDEGRGGRTALIGPDGPTTYAELAALTNRSGNVLRELGVVGDVDGDVEEARTLGDRDLVDVRAVGVADGIREIGGAAQSRQEEGCTGDRDPGRKAHPRSVVSAIA